MASNVPEKNEENVPDWVLAKRGINFLINNNAKEAQELFSSYPESLPMCAGYSFAAFMDALMTFEDDKLNLATSVLKEVERKCTSETGWFKSVKKAFGSSDNNSLAENLETQIILADSQVCLAILTFLQQDISGYFKGGWVLRKAWKVYQGTYQEILHLYKEAGGEVGAPLPEVVMEPLSPGECSSTGSEASKSDPLNGRSAQVDKETIERLMGAVSFGYGLFQLGISLLPPSLLRLTNFLGFGGNRQNGIACLMYAREGIDMRAPLATLSLLWYHTIVRPFYALDGSNVQAGVNAATQLLQESEGEYGQSALFLFFKGRVNRLNSDIPNALKSFQSSVENATQREIKILALHEVGWCHLIQLDYCNAENTFSYLKSWSRWSRAFYSYLAGICCGSCRNSSSLTNIKEIKTGVTLGTKGNQLDEFLSRRAKCCPSDDDELSTLPAIFWKLLVYEMLYLWNALPSCLPQNIEQIKRDCEQVGDGMEPMLGLSKLILGCCNCIQRQFSAGIANFRQCLDLRKGCPNNAVDAHVSAFSQYELGALLIKTNETKAEGKLLLQNIAQYKDYDFEQRLNVRVHSMLKHL
ncbi:tetratricopeptide repeat protein 39C isoform X2 [Tribolium castaneum]|uniref:tetratricopeptide repeat protein 39C isoform X2 n=1 Tax=Tribolium castaneum TaxID=7070 RepID=UPI00046C0516|nr:PREDICTED: tetratricopeptide repeat protein 39C isoform X2 [Tribolium castaneum]|eukprot:XP_008197438.1 PREDICTED: tetratricopeptide repeat protein 39C isoform X2 [Tribolium castaneum]